VGRLRPQTGACRPDSAHGLMEAFDRSDFAPIVVTHTGQMPAELPDLAGLIALALVADAERLCAGTWLR
jgi:hypothetical protein